MIEFSGDFVHNKTIKHRLAAIRLWEKFTTLYKYHPPPSTHNQITVLLGLHLIRGIKMRLVKMEDVLKVEMRNKKLLLGGGSFDIIILFELLRQQT